MQIVIDIPEHCYDASKTIELTEGLEGVPFHVMKAVANGTPLPKGHGRIIDESQVSGTFTWDNGYIECFASTIIEADKEE